MSETFDIIQFLKSAVATGASDEHLKVGYPPFVRINGFIKKINKPALTKNEIENAVRNLAPTFLKESILSMCDVDFMFEIQGCSRFRVNYNRQLGSPALVIRNIPYGIPSLGNLGLPKVMHDIIKQQNGIVLVTGPTGCGKSTTLASLINEINKTSSKHIITIEDPVEYVFPSVKSIVSQRQVGVDTNTFTDGIKYALRQDPDIIFIGEIRDCESMEVALKASETGHLVLTTLHTNDAVQTINRIINMFEESKRHIIRKQLAETLRATIAQKLVYSAEKNKRFPACEIMVVTPTIKDYIEKNNNEEIYELMKENHLDNMISMNESLAKLVMSGDITKEEAMEHSNDIQELDKFFKGIYSGTKSYYE